MQKTHDNTGFSKFHRDRNSNEFYFAHPEVWQPTVDVVIPPGYEKEMGWQSGEVMFRSMPENASLEDLFSNLEAPKRVTELGCGLGRASVWLAKYYKWTQTEFWLLDSTGMAPAWGINEKGTDDIYNDMAGTQAYVSSNIPNTVHYIDVAQPYEIPGPDLLMSFLAFGYHWSFIPYLQAFEDDMAEGSYAVFGTSGYDRGGSAFGGGIKARRFLEEMLSELGPKWAVLRDARLPEARKASLVVLRRTAR